MQRFFFTKKHPVIFFAYSLFLSFSLSFHNLNSIRRTRRNELMWFAMSTRCQNAMGMKEYFFFIAMIEWHMYYSNNVQWEKNELASKIICSQRAECNGALEIHLRILCIKNVWKWKISTFPVSMMQMYDVKRVKWTPFFKWVVKSSRNRFNGSTSKHWQKNVKIC